jgi:Phosphotransferase enzyme family
MMAFSLNQNNVFEYLDKLGYSSKTITEQIELLPAKNFNLLVPISDELKLLVKQERHNHEGKAAGEFLGEWQIHELVQKFLELQHWQSGLSTVRHFDAENSILVFEYLQDYRDLMDFYTKEAVFPALIAKQLGTFLATIHRDTYNHSEYREAISQKQPQQSSSLVQRLVGSLERITPEIFGSVPDDGLKFYALYQRYDSLGKALNDLGESFMATCLTHNDLKLNNILLHDSWEQPNSEVIRLIDWERSAWGDPAFDLGSLIGSYLQLWLGSLVVSKSLSIEESLGLAMTPLDTVQPSIAALTRSYLATFPQILADRPDFLQRVVQFAGLALIQGILASIEYQKILGNGGIANLQVAKSLLCRPIQSMPTVFGTLEFMPQIAAVA